MLLKVRKNFRYFKSTGYLHGLANGEICVFHGYSVDMFQVMAIIEETKSDVKVEYTIPKEGSIIYFDTLAIPSDAPNADTAHKWIDHILDPQVAANLSNASEFETNLLNGLDSEVGSHGIRLSRGQRQRSILARTLLRSRQKLVLDESINAVDSTSEVMIIDDIRKTMRDLTLIIIAHRGPAAAKADNVSALDEGHIIEQGTPKELLRDSNSVFLKF